MNRYVKYFATVVLGSMLGAAIMFVALRSDHPGVTEGLRGDLVHTSSTARNAMYANTLKAVEHPDFTVAAEVAMPAVVQIRARESEQLAQQRRQQNREYDPWGRFFDFDFDFGDQPFFNLPFGPYQPKQGAGSGVILSQDGYIVTNNHVIDFADQVEVRTFDGKEYEARVIGRDPSTDLAVLKIEATGLPTLEYANSDDAKVGEWVLAVGNPFEYLTSTVTAGIISAKGRDIDLIRGDKTIEEFIQTDAAINPGNSGGALVDAQGRLLGINTAIASYTGNYAGYSFAIPVNLMAKIVKDIIDNGGGVIERTSLGVYIDEMTPAFADELKIDVDKGLIIRSIVPGSAAEYAGLLPNDVIVGVDGEEVTTYDQLKKVVDYAKVGDVLSVEILRNGKPEKVDVKLRKRL